MLSSTLFVCLSLSLCSAAASLSCIWMELNFRQNSGEFFKLLDTMANNSPKTNKETAVDFPRKLYNQATRAAAADKLRFMAQVLEEMVPLFEEDHSAASWEEKTVENFQSLAYSQALGLRSCIGSYGHDQNMKLHRYFRKLRKYVLETMGHSAEAWELIRREMKTHLMRAELLAASLLNN